MTKTKEKQNIPERWFETTLDCECAFLKGQGLSKSHVNENGKFPCLLYGQLFTTYNEIITEVKSRTDSEGGVISEKGDVLIPASTTTVAKDLAIASALQQDGVHLGGDINILRKKNDSYDSNFLAYYLTHYKNKELSSYAQGITIIHLSSSNFKDLEICIPKSKKEQQKIAEVLGTVDEEIDKTKEVIKATEKLKKGLMQQLFTRGIGHTKFKQTELGEIPESWNVSTLEDASEKLVVGFVGTCEPYYTDSAGVPMLRTGNLKQWGVDLSELKYVTREFHEKNIKSQLKPGDILIARHGDNGLACIVPDSLEEANCLNIVIIRANKEILLPEFLYYAINSPLAKNQMASRTGGSTQKVVNTTEIKLVKIGVPSEKEQNKVIQILSSVDEKIAVNKKLLAKQTELKKGLMQDLLSGVKRVSV